MRRKLESLSLQSSRACVDERDLKRTGKGEVRRCPRQQKRRRLPMVLVAAVMTSHACVGRMGNALVSALSSSGGPTRKAFGSRTTSYFRPAFTSLGGGRGIVSMNSAGGTSTSSSSTKISASTSEDEGVTATVSQGQGERSEWTLQRVRSTFVDFFVEHPDLPHTYCPPSACAPLNDPTLLFTNAGMNQFKPIFLGQVEPTSPLASLQRACNSQKCIRAGGKHNDLEDVGRDTYHHTFFEMLGSWAFKDDYFKEEAIDMAWKLLTEVYGLDESRLYATYFGGDKEKFPDLEPDFEARDLWLRYLPESRVLACDAADNFWEMGDTGPCGPCSEVHFDRIGNRDAAALVNADDPDVIEIWNLVFVQYDRKPSGLVSLPGKHVDTGMGLERLVSILQDVPSNYDTDAFGPLLDALSTMVDPVAVGPYKGRLGPVEDPAGIDTAYRAIVDHARTLCFAIADGAVPSNMGRGYVLRRILRRGARYGRQVLGVKDQGVISGLIPTVVATYGEAYPELVANQDKIDTIIREEEASFDTMLDRGIRYFKEEVLSTDSDKVTGSQTFFLYDTLGFPLDLTELMAEEAGRTVDADGFAREMETQKERSRAARRKATTDGVDVALATEDTAQLNDLDVKVTDDSFKYLWDEPLDANLLAVYKDGRLLVTPEELAGVDLEDGDTVGIILDRTTFYAEAGGQESDVGTLVSIADATEATELEVLEAVSYAGYVLHTCVVSQKGTLPTHFTCKVDYAVRRKTAPNHTMTHILQSALRKELGDGVAQRGSQCGAERLRFDFSFDGGALKPDQLQRVESFVQEVVEADLPVTSTVQPLAEAQAIEGLCTVPGEVYPDPVRVISVGGGETSVEFCGGTHVQSTGEAGNFVLVEETAVAKGVRRIVALTGEPAAKATEVGQALADRVEAASSTPVDVGALRKDVDSSVYSAALKVELRTKIDVIQKQVAATQKAAAQQKVDQALQTILADEQESSESSSSLCFRTEILDLSGVDSKNAVKKLTTALQKRMADKAFLGLFLEDNDDDDSHKVVCFAIVPPSVQTSMGMAADQWVQSTLELVGGRGGGRANSAQGQAPNCSAERLPELLEQAQKYAEAAAATAAPNASD